MLGTVRTFAARHDRPYRLSIRAGVTLMDESRDETLDALLDEAIAGCTRGSEPWRPFP